MCRWWRQLVLVAVLVVHKVRTVPLVIQMVLVVCVQHVERRGAALVVIF